MDGQPPPNTGHAAPVSPYTTAPHPQSDYAAQTAAAALSSATAPPLSQQVPHIPTPNNTAAPNGRKRKAGQPGSRGVANLTPDQLAKKRANDREAQRAIRERTKSTIESLERRVRELESQQPYQELQRALQECEELRKRLSAVAGIVGNRDLGQTGLNELAALTAQQPPMPPVNGQQYPQQPPNGQYDQPPQQHLHPELRSPHSSHETESPVQNGGMYQAPESAARWPESSEHQHQQRYSPRSQPYEQQQLNPSANQMHQQPTGNGERHGLSFLLEQQHRSPSISSRPPSKSHADFALQIIQHQLPTCPLDRLLSDFITAQRRQLANGATLNQVLGSNRPAFAGLASPEATKRQHVDPISAVLIDILSKFPDIEDLPERMAVLYVMYYITRWLICPCERCWQLVPEWCRPLPLAADRNHATWTDYLPWPVMRKQLTLTGSDIKFDDFFVPFTLTLSLNWPYPIAQCLVPNPDTKAEDQMVLNPVFEDHLLRLDHWSLGKEFVNEFPEIIDESVRIIEQPRTRTKQSGRGFTGF